MPGGPIPACAGQPCRTRHWSACSRAYPRVCGATCPPFFLDFLGHGLSPRVRGNRSMSSHSGLRVGPIPACAGQPGWADKRFERDRAYPRVCGATQHPAGRGSENRGLSPRVRGNRQVLVDQRGQVGPIPACAGQPLAGLKDEAPTRAYPRVCGATWRSRQSICDHVGLSPRVRGNPGKRFGAVLDNGPIPACAGQPNGNG